MYIDIVSQQYNWSTLKHKYEYNWPINNQHRNNEQIIKTKSSKYVSRLSQT